MQVLKLSDNYSEILSTPLSKETSFPDLTEDAAGAVHRAEKGSGAFPGSPPGSRTGF